MVPSSPGLTSFPHWPLLPGISSFARGHFLSFLINALITDEHTARAFPKSGVMETGTRNSSILSTPSCKLSSAPCLD